MLLAFNQNIPQSRAISLGETERYLAYLRKIIKRVRLDHPTLPDTVTLQLSVKTCNNTTASERFVITLLVSSDMPRMPVHPQKHRNQREQLIMLHTVRGLMTKTTANMMLRTVLNRKSALTYPLRSQNR